MKNKLESLERTLLQEMGTNFLSLEEVDKSIEELANKAREFNPDCILGILTSGEYVARKVSQILNVKYQEIEVSRKSPNIFGVPLKDLVGVGKIMNYFTQFPLKVSGSVDVLNYQRVLLLDEECGSGLTFKKTSEIVKKSNPLVEIREGVITICSGDYSPNYFIDVAIPLNCLVGRVDRFPWVSYSPHYSRYLERLQILRNETS